MKTLAFVLLSLAACSPFDPDLGNAPYKCGDVEPRCPEGYACDTSDADPTRHVCVAPGGLTPDSGTAGFQCLDDSPFGMNDTFMTPTPTTIPTQGTMYSARAAICPELDKDHFAFSLTAASNTRVQVDWESGMPVNVSFLNAAGNSIGNGLIVNDKTFALCINALPQGNYFVSVFAASNVKNNYRLEIKTNVSEVECTPRN